MTASFPQPNAMLTDSAAVHEDPAVLQRAALRDLLTLARDCAGAQARADAAGEAALAELERVRKEAVSRLLALYANPAQSLRTKSSAMRDAAESEAKGRQEAAHERHAREREESARRHNADLAHLEARLRDEVMEFTGLFDAFQTASGQQLEEAKNRHAERGEQLAACRARIDRRVMAVAGKLLVDQVPSAAAEVPFDVCALEMEAACARLDRVSRGLWCDNGGDWAAAILGALAVGGGVFFAVNGRLPAVAGLPASAVAGVAAGAVGLFVGASVWAAGRVRRARRLRETLTHTEPAFAAWTLAQAAAAGELESVRLREAAARQAMEARHHADLTQTKAKFAPLAAKLADDAARREAASDQACKTELLAAGKARDAAVAVCEADLVLAAAKEHQRHLLSQRLLRGEEARRGAAKAERAAALAAVTERWSLGCERISRMISRLSTHDSASLWEWSSPQWEAWRPAPQASAAYRFGQLRLEGQLPGATPEFHLDLPKNLTVPALLPVAGSLFIEHDAAGRRTALDLLRTALARLLLAVPPGAVRLTMIDPVGLGEGFAGFMHLAESEVDLVGGRIWTAPEDIERKLADLTDHMENVIQKYLRNAYQTIEEYNAQAGELAEPYRVLVVADLPAAFSQVALERLSAIAQTGARCGVHVMVASDARHGALPESVRAALCREGAHEGAGAHTGGQAGAWVQCVGGGIHWRDPLYGRFPFLPDATPGEKQLTRLLAQIAAEAGAFQRVEVPFTTITPKDGELWSRSAAAGLRVPVGKSGVAHIQEFDLGRGTRQHALVAGKTGSGKSSFLNAVITNLALWYAPDEAQVLLIDFKKGIEFKAYAQHAMPHAQAVAIESDLEFGLSVLRRLDAEMEKRGNLFRAAGVQDLAAWRSALDAKASGLPADAPKLARLLLVIDEFQEFFTRDDKLSQDAAMLLDRIARQGRAFGVHMLLGSQTLGGGAGIPRSTLGQMAVRVALQCDESDAQLILSDTNTAARLLARPGEAIYNDAAGKVEANTPFQVAWLPDNTRDTCLARVRVKAEVNGLGAMRPIVFEGGKIADPSDNAELVAVLAHPSAISPAKIKLWLGSPVAIKEPTCAVFGRGAGDNLLIVGQSDEAACGVVATALLGLAAQDPAAQFTVLDGTPEDAPLFGALRRVLALAAPARVRFPVMREAEAALVELHAEVKRRTESGAAGERRFLAIQGLQRYRALRKSESGYSFSLDAQEGKPPAADKMLADIVKDGPAVGIHVVVWADSHGAFERCFDRLMLREFDHRLLFQLSAADSSNLMDAGDAAQLGPNRALLFSEERGVKEKCLPYRVPG